MTSSLYFQFESVGLQNKGMDFYVPTTCDIIVTGIQLKCAASPFKITGNSPAGGGLTFEDEFAEVLYQVRLYPTIPAFTSQAAPAYAPPGPGNPEFGAFQTFNPAGAPGGAGVGGGGFLLSGIGKLTMGESLNDLIVLPPGSLDMMVPKGGCVLWHLDQAGVPVDAELQGVLFYKPAAQG